MYLEYFASALHKQAANHMQHMQYKWLNRNNNFDTFQDKKDQKENLFIGLRVSLETGIYIDIFALCKLS